MNPKFLSSISRVIVLATSIAACGDPSIDRPDAGAASVDASMSTGPQVPVLNAMPARLPYPIVTVRGRAPNAKRIIIEGAGNPIASALLPDGSFCADVPLPATGRYQIEVFAQGDDGAISHGAATFTIEFDPRAPSSADLETCSGSDPAGCPSAVEICDNGRDDDCDNLIDARDPACATCEDDAFEPNDDSSAPRVDPGRYTLFTCPANNDWFGLYVRAHETITARAFFAHAAGNIDLQLLAPGGRSVIARSTSMDDDESIVHTTTTAGEYELVVFGDSEKASAYTLELDIDSP